MKTTKLFISIILVALTTSTFGIHHSPISNDKTIVGTSDVSHKHKKHRMEDWMIIPFKAPAAENPVILEEWMCTPFEVVIPEKDVRLESWMILPFENTAKEEKLDLEDWMVSPMWS